MSARASIFLVGPMGSGKSAVGRRLAQGLRDCVKAGQQAILFLNRRGSAPIVQCRDCGYVLRCRSCDIPLTYHADPERRLCHQCNRRSSVPQRCPNCRGHRIRYLGLGTQRVVQELERLAPGVATLRWDRDVTRPERSHTASGEANHLSQIEAVEITGDLGKTFHGGDRQNGLIRDCAIRMIHDRTHHACHADNRRGQG
ncbi:MAG: hypothetical protein IH805_01010 [Proteobacteria bacterium]|nr:hypothetical protein [Pseudomonadota bacterium]